MADAAEERKQKRRSLAMNPIRRELSLNETTRHREKMQESFRENSIPEVPNADPMPHRRLSTSGTPPVLGGTIAVPPRRRVIGFF